MTSIDAMADEIMKGLTDYADLADTAMKKAVRDFHPRQNDGRRKAVPSLPSFLRSVRRS